MRRLYIVVSIFCIFCCPALALFALQLCTLNKNSAMHMNPPLVPSRAFLHARAFFGPKTVSLYASQKAIERRPSTHRIPHIIHQSWKNKEVKPFQREWQKTWLDNHPNWRYMFWTDEDNRELIADKFPQFLSIYDNLPSSIERADCSRYFYMLQYGGVYIDLDFESLKPIEPLLENVQVALAYMTQDKAHPLSIPNAFMASVPGHNFWWYVVKHILRNYESGQVDRGDPFRISGPVMLKEAVTDYQATSGKKDLTIFKPKQVYGVDWNWHSDASKQDVFRVCHASDPAFNATHCKTFFPDAYSITYWSGDITWGG